MRGFVREWVLPLLVAVAVSLLLRTFVAEARIIPSGSMEPTIQVRDRVLVDKLFYRFVELKRGDVVVFRPPDGVRAEYPFIKRVIGLPGDTVWIEEGVVFVNGRSWSEPHQVKRGHDNFGPVTVPEGCLFVLGDNRPESMDSRAWGFVGVSSVLGKADWIIWPFSHAGRI